MVRQWENWSMAKEEKGLIVVKDEAMDCD